jgi:hypothetical protein
MKSQFQNKVISSFFLWAEHTLLEKGEAFVNHGSKFYPVQNLFNGYYTYALPFKGLVADASISGANLLTGVYLNNIFITKGQSGLHDINHEQGQVYFSGQLASTAILSGNYAIKDVNVTLTNIPDEVLLFETKYYRRPRVGQTVTGLEPNAIPYPVMFIKDNGGFNEEFAFGGMDRTTINIKVIILMDSQFGIDAVTSIFKDRARTLIPLVESAEMPFNNFGGYTSGTYNYKTLTAGKTAFSQYIYLDKVFVSKFNINSLLVSELKKINPEVYPAILDFEIETFRYPRL